MVNYFVHGHTQGTRQSRVLNPGWSNSKTYSFTVLQCPTLCSMAGLQIQMPTRALQLKQNIYSEVKKKKEGDFATKHIWAGLLIHTVQAYQQPNKICPLALICWAHVKNNKSPFRNQKMKSSPSRKVFFEELVTFLWDM